MKNSGDARQSIPRLSPFEPIRDIAAVYPDIKQESVFPVSGARTVFLNVDAAISDFFGCSMTEVPSKDLPGIASVLADFFAEDCAIISKPQRDGSVVNPPTGGTESGMAWRPPRYGRALVIERSDAPRLAQLAARLGCAAAMQRRLFIDVKGCGVAPGTAPVPERHRTGLLLLNEAIEEFALQSIVDRALAQVMPSVYTLPVYAVVLLPFRGYRGDEGEHYAVLTLRRAHARAPDNNEVPTFNSAMYFFKLEVEFALRRCGVTSSGGPGFSIREMEDGLRILRGARDMSDTPRENVDRFLEAMKLKLPFAAELINVQGTSDVSASPISGELLDFGQYEIRDAFDAPLMALAMEYLFGCGGILWPDNPNWVVPEPELAFDGGAFALDTSDRNAPFYHCAHRDVRCGPFNAFKMAALREAARVTPETAVRFDFLAAVDQVNHDVVRRRADPQAAWSCSCV